MPWQRRRERRPASSISCADEKHTNIIGAPRTAGTSAVCSTGRRLMPALPDHLPAPLLRCAEGDLPPNIALMHLFMKARDEKDASNLLDEAIAVFEQQQNDTYVSRLRVVRELWLQTPGS